MENDVSAVDVGREVAEATSGVIDGAGGVTGETPFAVELHAQAHPEMEAAEPVPEYPGCRWTVQIAVCGKETETGAVRQ